MDVVILKTTAYLVLMIVFLILAFITNDQVDGQFFASLGIITWAFARNSMSENY